MSALIVAAVGAAMMPSSAQADGQRDLDDGIAFYNALDTDRAQSLLQAASRAWDLKPVERAQAYLYLGMLSYELGRSGAAARLWQVALVLDANQSPPSNASPKILRAFARARRTMPTPPPKVPRQDPPPPGVQKTPEPPAPKATSPTPPPPPSALDLSAPPPPPDTPRVDLGTPTSTQQSDEEGGTPWLWVGLGGAAVAAGVAVLVVVLAGGSEASSECAQGGGGCVTVTVR
ncbi:MAG: tetratricopeptide repeat protein [Myxococcota bacterium]